jgi:hypothetical protein
MASSGMFRRVALVRTDVTEELSSSIIRVTRTGKLGTLAVTSNRCTWRKNTTSQKTPFFMYYIGLLSPYTSETFNINYNFGLQESSKLNNHACPVSSNEICENVLQWFLCISMASDDLAQKLRDHVFRCCVILICECRVHAHQVIINI